MISICDRPFKTVHCNHSYYHLKSTSPDYFGEVLTESIIIQAKIPLQLVPVIVSIIKQFIAWKQLPTGTNTINDKCVWNHQIDRVLAATLPIGRYPVCTPRASQWLVLMAWIVALGIGAGVTTAAGARFEPSLLLCAPGLPQEFGITLISLYCSAFASMVVGYVVLIITVG